MKKKIFPIKNIYEDKAKKTYNAYREFRENIRKKHFKLIGYDMDEALKLESEIVEGMKKYLKEISLINLEVIADSTKILDDFECGSTRTKTLVPPPTRYPELDFVEPLDPLGTKTKVSGHYIEWDHLTDITQCVNGQIIPSGVGSGCQEGQGEYIEGCHARGVVEISGSIADGIEHCCRITMMHDYEFVAPETDWYRFKPNYTIKSNISLSGSDEIMDFSNSARISLIILIDGDERDRKKIYYEENKSLMSEAVYQSEYFTEPPMATASLDKLENVTISVGCELEVKARNTAFAKIDIGYPDNANLYFKAPELRVEYEEKTIPILSKQEIVIVTTVPDLEPKEPPDLPFKYFRHDW